MGRVNSRLAGAYGFEGPFIRGLGKMRQRISMALTIMLALALGRLQADQGAHLRSLVRAARTRPRAGLLGTVPHVPSSGQEPDAANRRQDDRQTIDAGRPICYCGQGGTWDSSRIIGYLTLHGLI